MTEPIGAMPAAPEVTLPGVAVAWPEGDLVGFDLETTGTDALVDVPVQYAIVSRTAGKMRVATEIVNPGRPIPPEATEVHGITDEQAAQGIDLEQAVRTVATELLDASQRRVPLIGMNLAYDLTILDSSLRRFGSPGLVEIGWNGPVLDLQVLDKQFDTFRRGKRRLSDLCEHYGVVGKGAAHEAMSDVYAAVRCVLALASATTLGEQDPAELHQKQVGWYREQHKGLSEYFVGQGKSPIPEFEWEWPIWRQPAGRPDEMSE